MKVTFWKDGSGRAYSVELVRNGDFVECGKVYREATRGKGDFSFYRESCHGKLPNHAKFACFDAIQTFMYSSRAEKLLDFSDSP